jgi:hypothetical protein
MSVYPCGADAFDLFGPEIYPPQSASSADLLKKFYEGFQAADSAFYIIEKSALDLPKYHFMGLLRSNLRAQIETVGMPTLSRALACKVRAASKYEDVLHVNACRNTLLEFQTHYQVWLNELDRLDGWVGHAETLLPARKVGIE